VTRQQRPSGNGRGETPARARPRPGRRRSRSPPADQLKAAADILNSGQKVAILAGQGALIVGRSSDSFVMNDLMRLPLGILTGVGFIGGGVILRRGDIVVGVTTAATLWLLTLIGLCLGGGQIALGIATTGIGLLAVWVLKWVEGRLRQEKRARLAIELDSAGPGETEVRRLLCDAGLSIVEAQVILDCAMGRRKLVFEVREFRLASNTATPAFVGELASTPGVVKLHWDRTV
jgi:putative Mg2+ transporter-C (MgtC) family protein